MQYAAVQTIVLIIGIWKCRRFPAFLLSITVNLPFLWLDAALMPYLWHRWWPFVPPNDGAYLWQYIIWLPCVTLLIPLQAIAAMEAVFRFGERYWLAPSITGMLAGLGVLTTAAWWVRPHGDIVGQVVQVARYQRVACCTVLVGAVVFYAIERWKGLVSQPGAHLCLCAVLSVLWVVPIVSPIPPTWTEWLRVDWMVAARTWVLVAWVPLVALRRPRLFQRGYPFAKPLHFTRDTL